MAAMSGAFWGYDGWNSLTYIAGEIKNPQRNIVRALFFGLLMVIVVYVTINFAYLYVFDIQQMAQSKLVASDVAVAVAGLIGGSIVAAAIMMSTFGASNGSVMSSARIYFAMAREGLFFKNIGKLHPKYETPHNSLLLQATWASLLVLSGTFDILTDMLVFVAWIFYAFSAVSVIILRKREPDTPRPYKVWGYPFIPVIFILVSSTFLVVTLYNDITMYMRGETQIINSVFGLAIVALGIPFYYYFSRKKQA
jgi:APA family basic amino acid/polyamine antiporter